MRFPKTTGILVAIAVVLSVAAASPGVSGWIADGPLAPFRQSQLEAAQRAKQNALWNAVVSRADSGDTEAMTQVGHARWLPTNRLPELGRRMPRIERDSLGGLALMRAAFAAGDRRAGWILFYERLSTFDEVRLAFEQDTSAAARVDLNFMMGAEAIRRCSVELMAEAVYGPPNRTDGLRNPLDYSIDLVSEWVGSCPYAASSDEAWPLRNDLESWRAATERDALAGSNSAFYLLKGNLDRECAPTRLDEMKELADRMPLDEKERKALKKHVSFQNCQRQWS